MFTVKLATLIGRTALVTTTVIATAIASKAVVEAIGDGLSSLGGKIKKTVKEADRMAA